MCFMLLSLCLLCTDRCLVIFSVTVYEHLLGLLNTLSQFYLISERLPVSEASFCNIFNIFNYLLAQYQTKMTVYIVFK